MLAVSRTVTLACRKQTQQSPGQAIGGGRAACAALGPLAQLSQNQLLMGACAPSAAMQLGRPHSGCRYALRAPMAALSRGGVAAALKPASDTANVLHTLGAAQKPCGQAYHAG